MYGYNEYISLSPEQILSIVSEKDIFHLFIKEEIITDKGALYKAPYRNDEHPDCYFEEFDNKLYFDLICKYYPQFLTSLIQRNYFLLPCYMYHIYWYCYILVIYMFFSFYKLIFLIIS